MEHQRYHYNILDLFADIGGITNVILIFFGYLIASIALCYTEAYLVQEIYLKKSNYMHSLPG